MRARTVADPYDLARFVTAQEGDFERACAELEAGAKRTHWMWYVFPQLQGLGRSAMAERYAIADVGEARAYLNHPVLGPRLRTAVEAAMRSSERDPSRLFGSPDDLKFRSSLTLFAAADPTETVFEDALTAFYGGEADGDTLERLGLPRKPPRRSRRFSSPRRDARAHGCGGQVALDGSVRREKGLG
ncbi:DUF1810 domain-containing protein [Acuticoccus sp.]|uniref:DUF1810 domain-containing protein n=1 Tax=Acuticoccus sp. TaxID=1904378 RepID=UPI003B515B02